MFKYRFFLYWRLCFFWLSGPVEGFYLLCIYIKGCTWSMLFSVSFFFTMVQKAGAARECLGSFEWFLKRGGTHFCFFFISFRYGNDLGSPWKSRKSVCLCSKLCTELGGAFPSSREPVGTEKCKQSFSFMNICILLIFTRQYLVFY